MKKLVRSKTPSSVPTHTYMFKGYLNNAINMFDNCRKIGRSKACEWYNVSETRENMTEATYNVLFAF